MAGSWRRRTLLAVPGLEIELTKLACAVSAVVSSYLEAHARFLCLSIAEEAVPQLWRGGGWWHGAVMIRAHGKREICQAQVRRAFVQARRRQARGRARLFAQWCGRKGGVMRWVVRRSEFVKFGCRNETSLIARRVISAIDLPR